MVDPSPVPPAAPGAPAAVTLHGGDLAWRPVSPRLARVRLITLAVFVVPLLLAAVVLGGLVTRWALLGAVAVLVVALWSAWVIVRQVSAISWVELDEEIVIRRGRLFRTPRQRPVRPAAVRRHPVGAAHALAGHRDVRDPHRLARERRLPARAPRCRGRGPAHATRRPR